MRGILEVAKIRCPRGESQRSPTGLRNTPSPAWNQEPSSSRIRRQLSHSVEQAREPVKLYQRESCSQKEDYLRDSLDCKADDIKRRRHEPRKKIRAIY